MARQAASRPAPAARQALPFRPAADSGRQRGAGQARAVNPLWRDLALRRPSGGPAPVVQQRTPAPTIQRTPACPQRPAGEAAQSRTADGILPANVVFTPSSVSQLDVRD